jgi:hypothetical protein
MEAGMTRNSLAALAAMGMAAMLMAGCHMEESKNGDSKNVRIDTPFGGMNVKTNDKDVLASIGLPAYPGAVAVDKDDDEHRSADVDMSFGDFQLRVKVATFRTDDATDKVEAFYRDGLRRYGGAIACRNNQPLGSPAMTAEGLTCDSKHGGHITVHDTSGNHQLELRAGSEHHQHIVTIDPDGGGTKFSLVALDLPGNFTSDGDNGGKRQ